MRITAASHRIQLTPSFGFREAREIAQYISALVSRSLIGAVPFGEDCFCSSVDRIEECKVKSVPEAKIHTALGVGGALEHFLGSLLLCDGMGNL